MLTVNISRPATVKQSKAGNAYKEQSGTAQLIGRDGQPEEAPRIIKFITDVDYPVGKYTISDASFSVGAYDKLEVGRLVLVPVGKDK